jgi:hypothetical protein
MSTRKSKIHYSNRSVNENPDYRLLSSKTIWRIEASRRCCYKTNFKTSDLWCPYGVEIYSGEIHYFIVLFWWLIILVPIFYINLILLVVS